MSNLVQPLLTCREKRDWRGVLRLGERLLKTESSLSSDEQALIEAYLAQAHRHLFERAQAQQMVISARSKATPRSLAEAYALTLGTAIHADRGAITTALAWGNEFLEHLPEYAAEARLWAGHAAHNLAHALRSIGEPLMALSFCQQAFNHFEEQDPGMARYMEVHQAQIYCDLRDTFAATQTLAGVTEENVDRQHIVDYLAVRATLAYLMGNYSEALEYAVRVLAYPVGSRSFDINDAEMCSLMGAVLWARGHVIEAERYTKRARERFEMAGRLDLAKLAIWQGGRAT